MYKILGLSLVTLVLVIVGFNAYKSRENNQRFQYLVYGADPIQRLEIKTSGRLKKVNITDKNMLDSLHNALRSSVITKGIRGKMFQVSADVYVYKGTQKIELLVTHSENGWYAAIRSKKFKCGYLFQLINRIVTKE